MSKRVTFVPDPETLPINDLLARYPGEWCLVKTLDPNMPVSDAPGQCLAHGPTLKSMYKAERKIRERDPLAMLGVLHGDMRFGDGEAFRRALARANESDEIVTLHGW
jgi:hypothetical protein